MRAPRTDDEGRTQSGRTVTAIFDPDGTTHGWAVTIDGEAAHHPHRGARPSLGVSHDG